MPVYRVDLLLCEDGGPKVLATKTTRMHMNDLPAFEYQLALKGRELIKDAEYHAGTKPSAG